MTTAKEVATTPIPVFKPLLEEEEFAACADALKLGWLGMGSYVREFEAALKELVQAKDRHVCAVNTGHSALHLGLLAAGVRPGDEVITPAFNNVADFQAILAVGAEPVFCDIDRRTLCIDLNKAEKLVSPRTKLAIVMDYDCVLCDHDQVAEFGKRHGLRILHDAAHALGSKYRGKMVGSFSDICMFSFDPVKTITCIDGGALVVKTAEEAAQIHEMRLIGMGQSTSVMYKNQRSWTYDVNRVGYRYHMANLHAALGLAQLRKFDRIARTRREACRVYNARLGGIGEVVVPQTDFEDVVPFLYYILVPPQKRQPLRDHMTSVGIDTGIHWQPGHWFSLFKGCRRGDLSVTDDVAQRILSLPLHSCMQESDQERVASAIEQFFAAK
jgi:dTDP-4-amino-4,6-dideoxygalactose transaminase